MASTMMRVREEIHALLHQLSRDEGISKQEVLIRALEAYRRARMFEQANDAYAVLQANPAAWHQEIEERAAWDCTLLDDIDAETITALSPEKRRMLTDPSG